MAELDLTEEKQEARKLWASGDYPAIATMIEGVGRLAVERGDVSADDKVLDVACGAGNATIPAAARGAEVTGLDLTPELLEAARAAAAEAGVEIDWVEGDAEDLPFEGESFDVVLSVFGCMFAPDHRAAAQEISRVLRPGGRIAICSWTPEGATGRFFMTIGSHMPPPPEGFQPPVLWGSEDHARELFEGTGIELSFDRAAVEFEFESGEAMIEEFSEKLGPFVAARAALEPEGRWEALRDDVLALLAELNTSAGGDLRYPAEYLVVTGRKA